VCGAIFITYFADMESSQFMIYSMYDMFQEGTVNTAIALAVGDSFHLKTGKDWIYYAGMPSENVYSIVQKKSTGYQGFAWNLFYPRKQTEIRIDGVSLFVESVSPQEIRISVRQ